MFSRFSQHPERKRPPGPLVEGEEGAGGGRLLSLRKAGGHLELCTGISLQQDCLTSHHKKPWLLHPESYIFVKSRKHFAAISPNRGQKHALVTESEHQCVC